LQLPQFEQALSSGQASEGFVLTDPSTPELLLEEVDHLELSHFDQITFIQDSAQGRSFVALANALAARRPRGLSVRMRHATLAE